VPENWTKDDKWTMEVIGAFFDYRQNLVVVSIASDAATILKASPQPPYTFSCVFFYDGEYFWRYITENQQFSSKFSGSNIVSEVQGHFFTSYLFHCPLPNNKKWQNKITTNDDDSILIPKELAIIRNDSISPPVNDWRVQIIDLRERMKNRYLNGYTYSSVL